VRVLIAGVTGYLGGALCASLIADGHEVIGTSRDAGRAIEAVPGLTRAVAWSPAAGPLSADALDGVEVVVNLIGEPVAGRWTYAKKRRIRETRVEGTENLVRGIEATYVRPSVLVSASAVGYYGDRGGDELTESEPSGHDFLAVVTDAWERAAEPAMALGLRVVRLRTGLVIGRGSPFLRSQLPLFKLGLGGSLGSGKQWWSWVHVDDWVGIVRYAIVHETLAGPVNATSPSPARQREFAKAVGRVLRRPVLLPGPAFAIKLVLGEFASEVLTSKRVLPSAAAEAGYAFAFTDVEVALRDALGR
jgi:uncharacterized protein (TIGR01777 family)